MIIKPHYMHHLNKILLQYGVDIKYELLNAVKIINCENNYSSKKYVKELEKYHKTELKLKYEFMYIICSNNNKSGLSHFFSLNAGLRGNIGRIIISYINAF
jgi:hypothetical protein